MPVDDPSDLPDIDRDIHINELKEEANELTGGEMVAWESPDCPAGIGEQFWERVVAWEKAPRTSHFEQLTRAGLELPLPDELDDDQLTAKLWELIHALAGRRAFLSNTNHLSDRELYNHLLEETLHEAIPDLPFDENGAWHIDILGGCSEEDLYLNLKYYADEEWRAQWAKDFPQDEIPPHEDPPYDRDRHLPQAEYGPTREPEE
jgi:hypothetical protein